MLHLSFLSRQDLSLIILLFLTELTRSAFFLTFWPLYTVHFLNASVAGAGLVVSAHYFTETVFKTAVGCQLDRHGKPVLLAGLLLSLLALLGLFQQHATWLAVFWAGLFGLGFAPIWLAVVSRVAPIGHPDRAARMGAVFSAWLLGAGAGPVSINFVLTAGFRTAFQLLIGIWVICLVVGILVPLPAQGAGKQLSLADQLRKLAADPMVVKILLPGMFLQTMAASLLLPILPVYATGVLGLSSRQYGLLLTAGGAATVLFLIPMGKLADRWPLKKLLTAGFLLSALFLSLLTRAHSFPALMLLAVLVGFSYAAVLPAWNSLLARAIPPEQQATGWGIFTTLEGLGIAVGPVLGGAIFGWLHPTGAIFLSAFILAGMGLFYLYYPFDRTLSNQE
ncbi:MFS transporter [Desulforamulus hydrothermalis]|uniref:Major facilitator superfamily MFS_1 n=1 Tax=Desulforamulus hydrothermalis Lam5 = DSM 18033 TaxID=1121428 RepID=K8DZV3_9FIRM|nr:MFS transporter [Desulforamulus hydrothermalis]CCO08699.1 Major facilitator superfamily MFS_1 [Desulforamulus hydrothermalis Lam5 = DSM 18033]SHG69495.1 Predicted arabinose efflux permease, MFS family [Desulforamulus hydrothermalis Lam5 = DSM 18033]